MTCIQYFSDLKLDNKSYIPKIFPKLSSFEKSQNTNICILAGDVGCPFRKPYWKLLSQVNFSFDHVILILGNTEFYGAEIPLTIQYVEMEIKQKKLSNVYLLNNSCIQIKNIIILGCTLWSNIPQFAEKEILTKINDYKQIKNFTISEQNTFHKNSVKWLSERLISKETNKIYVVVTHHSPIFESVNNPKFRSSLTNYAFGTDLHDLVLLSDYWIYGHTHFNYRHDCSTKNKTTDNLIYSKLRTNQYGNKEEPLDMFDHNAEIIIKF